MLLPGWFIIVGALTVPLASDPQWRPFTPEDARFEISMPAEPIVAVEYVEYGKNRVRMNMATAHLETSDEFMVTWSEYPKGTPSNYDRTFDKMRDALAEAKNANVLSEHAVTLRGHHGRWITMRMDNDDQVEDVIFYFTPTRVYEIMAHTPIGDEYKAQRARFLESFKLNSDA